MTREQQMSLVLLPAVILTTPADTQASLNDWLVTSVYVAALAALWLTMRK